jgi:hypothetical protein
MHLLELSQSVDVERLCAFLRDVHVSVGVVGGGMLEASIPGAQTAHHERRELLGYVTTWNALNPAMRIELA